MKQQPITDLATLKTSFTTPPRWARPTPLYWWSGSDLDRDRLAWQLDRLAAEGIGGTIVGYSHRPDGDLDHGHPVPFSNEWWELYVWFVEASARRGLTAGIQDYGVLNPLLVTLGDRLGDRDAGSLEHVTATVEAGQSWALPLGGATVVSVRAWPFGSPPLSSEPPHLPVVREAEVLWNPPPGRWTVSVVTKRSGRIGPWNSSFDPLHPDSGTAVIEAFYEPFAERLGAHFGTTFTTFFQDELEFGLLMPMWNDDIADACAARGLDPEHWVHALWFELDAGRFRAFYRDTVVGMLEQHYFRPIHEWHERHGTQLVMDQLSRGDLRTGRRHYGDYLETMKWYQGPGNDDPDLGRPRHSTEFRVSASIAHLHDRPLVVNEAFHSSGWGVSPADIVAGANAGFVAGANHVILHAVYYSTEGGWWEWAAPDFHFRQPWWRHSAALWNSLARTSALLRSGANVADVALMDPTQDLEMTGGTVRSPELAFEVIGGLGALAVNADLVPMSAFASAVVSGGSDGTTGARGSDAARGSDGALLGIVQAEYRAVVLPGIQTLRQSALDALDGFVAAGGVVIAAGGLPRATEFGPIAENRPAGWQVCGADAAAVAEVVGRMIEPDIVVSGAELAVAHRHLRDADCYFVVNTGSHPVRATCSVRGALGSGEVVTRWCSETGESGSAVPTRSAGDRTEFPVDLAPGEAGIFVRGIGAEPSAAAVQVPGRQLRALSIPIDGPWSVALQPTLDNSHEDFEYGGRALGVQSWHIETAAAADGPWRPRSVRDAVRFFVLGPVPPGSAAELAAQFSMVSRLDVDLPVSVDGSECRWRPYSFSLKTGIADDPLQRDRMTGPHGLKGVSDDFLDTAVVDPDCRPGDVYLFWSTVDAAPHSTEQTMTVSTRCALDVWVAGERLAHRDEVAVHRFAPWNLRDARPNLTFGQLTLTPGVTGVLIALTVAADQPTRAAVAIGGAAVSPRPTSRMTWWHGPAPAVEYRPVHAGVDAASVWVRAIIPPGADSVVVEATEPVMEARAGGVALAVTRDAGDAAPPAVTRRRAGGAVVSAVDLEGQAGPLLIRLGDSTLEGREPAVLEPLDWQTSEAIITLAPWNELGLADYSGAMTYRASVEVPDVEPASARLELAGLVGTAAVRVDGVPAGIIFRGSALDVTAAVRPGVNRIEIEVANTLANFAVRLPSPFSGVQPPSGGFTSATLQLRIALPSATQSGEQVTGENGA